jgi:putative pyoverdin transport system ATP-binding/permease protein
MNLLYFLLRASKLTVLLIVIIGILSGIGSASLIVLINSALSQSERTGGPLVWGYGGLIVLVLASGVACQVLSANLTQTAIFDLRVYLGRRILSAPLRQLEEIGTHRILASLTDDINVIAMFLLAIPELCISFVTLIVCLTYLAWLSTIAFLALIVFIVFGVAVYQLLQAKAMKSLSAGREQWDGLMGHFRSLTEGTKELKLHHQRREDFLNKVLRGTAQKLRSYNIKGMTTFAVAGTWSNLLFYIVMGLLLFALPLVKQIDLQTLTGYTLVVLYMTGPLGAIISAIPQFGRANIAMLQVNKMGITLTTDVEKAEPAELLNPNYAWHRLDFKGVVHTYHREQEASDFILGPLEVSFTPGEIVFLIGGNGSGKSTFAKLLTGLYTPESGELRLNGEQITDANREHYRQFFSAVFSDFYLFESLLGMMHPQIDSQAEDFLVRLQLDHKVKVKDGVLSTTKLSQGQRKRLALLTAYLENRPFYVFDEWASDQDPMFKEIFYTQLLTMLKNRGKTVLVITHDEKYQHVADRIIKLDYGKLEYDRRFDKTTSAQLPGIASDLANAAND